MIRKLLSKETVQVLIFMIGFWFILSLFAAMIKAAEGNCDKTYPIDYIFATNLFCENKPHPLYPS